ncbi:WD40 repeat domain-containing protein [Yeosuana sp. AK3]
MFNNLKTTTMRTQNTFSTLFLVQIDKEKHDGHLYSVNKLIWSTYNNYLISAGDDRTIIIWEININRIS